MILKRQTVGSALTLQFVLILGLSSLIATLGLLSDSAVTVIGAMLIAPLMKPIMATAYGIVLGDRRLLGRALLTALLGIAVTIIVSAATEQTFDLRGPTGEIMGRTHPNLLDLGVAIAAGIAATLAVTRPDVAEALPGVAIAVALVPPLCVTGVGLSNASWEIALGALLLFTINFLAIVLCAVIVFLIDGYGSRRRAAPGLALLALSLGALAPWLYSSFEALSVQDAAQQAVVSYLRGHYDQNGTVHPNDLRRLGVKVFEDHVFVFVEIEAPQGAISADNRVMLHEEMERQIGRKLNLKVQIVHTDESEIRSRKQPAGFRYGKQDLIQRR